MSWRNMVARPYSDDEKRIVNWLFKLTNNQIGGGDDPIGFFMASYESVLHERKELKQHIAALQLDNDRLHALCITETEPGERDLAQESFDIGCEYQRIADEEKK
jgi:hypothetical protein